MIASLVCLALVAAVTPADGYRDLFNGTDLDGWVVEGPKAGKDGVPIWSVEDGRIVCSGKTYGFLRYDKQPFGDFALRVEYRFEAPPAGTKSKANSGLGIRTVSYDPKKSDQTRSSFAAYEIQLLDDADTQPNAHGTGSLYRYKAPAANRVKPAPAWDVVEVTCVGPRVTVAFNGETVLDADQTALRDMPAKELPRFGPPAPKDKPLRGSVALQSHDGRVEFRTVRVKELGK